MTKNERRQIRDAAYKVLECIFIGAEDSVAKDLNTKVRVYINVLVAERDEARKELDNMRARPCEGEFGRLDAAWRKLVAERDALKAELQPYRDAGITEELLRKGDGYVKVGCGCLIISATYLDELKAEIAALKTRYDSMQRCLLKERDALQAKVEELKIRPNSTGLVTVSPIVIADLRRQRDNWRVSWGAAQKEIAKLKAKVAALDAVEVGSTLCPLEDVQDALNKARTRLEDGRVKGDGLGPLDTAINLSLLLVQACLEE